MNVEEFSLGDSLIHRVDPRIKILAALIFSVVVALSDSLIATAVAFIFPSVLVILARVRLKSVLLRLAVANTFVVFLWFLIPFTHPGEVILSIGPLDVNREGVLHALLITLKCNSIVLAVIALLGTSQVFPLVHALSGLGVPDKLVHLFFFCYRYIHVVHEEYHRLVNAMKIRGFRPGTDLHTYRTYSYLVGMLLVRSFDRSWRIVAAMKCRGFKEKFYI
ncbi:MAG: cobalt ECF transporter T component CbiQ, partial [Deltaproteobacteria bacterium]|nr:cobalt ECF transporter T component CbiQ [Deltaproteobacteria bacterium]